MRAQGTRHRIVLQSPTLRNGEPIPRQHTADGANRSPELSWGDVPPGTKELAVMCEDKDTFEPNQVPFLQWVVHSIPPTARGLPEGIPNVPLITAPEDIRGAVQARTAFDVSGYRGPQPLVGEGAHRYRFVIYAIDTELSLPPNVFANAVLSVIGTHIIGEGEIAATYERNPSRR